MTGKGLDAIVIGGGPGGAAAGLALARSGRSVVLIEKERFPRFHIGESFLPLSSRVFRELRIEEKVARLPQVAKYGAEFGFAHQTDGGMLRFLFDECLVPCATTTMNVERSVFDAFLLEEAERAGVEVRPGVKIERILRLEDGAVKVAAGADSIRAQWLIDASGAATVVGRHLGARRVVPGLEMVAHFGHFTGARRNTGRREGDPTIVMCREGWFWFIPLNAKVTSVGLVMDREAARQSGVAASRRLFWGIERCPVLAERMAGADGPEENEVVADFSYRCRPYAGPGHFLVGDAATFIDPIFSTGVALAMKAGLLAAEGVGHLLEGASPRRVRRRYVKTIESATGELFRMVRAFYDHSFRELLLSAKAPLRMRDAAVSVFSGEVFPRSPARIRWRLALFRLCVRIQRRVALAPRQETWSLLRNRPEPSTRDLRRQRP